MSLKDKINSDKIQRYPASQRETCLPQRPNRTQARVFSGNKPIAYLDDLKLLHHEVTNWLTGRIHDFGYFGYVPLQQDGTINPDYVNIKIADHNIPVTMHASQIDFHGNMVQVSRDPKTNKITVWIDQEFAMLPRYSYLGFNNRMFPSHMYLDEQTRNRMKKTYVPYDGFAKVYGDWTAGEQVNTINASNEQKDMFVLESKYPVGIKGNKDSKFTVSVLGPQQEQIAVLSSVSVTGDSQNILISDPFYVYLKVYDFQQDGRQFAAKLQFGFNMTSYLVQSKRFSIRITQDCGPGRGNFAVWNSQQYMYLMQKPVYFDLINLAAKIQNPQRKVKSSGTVYVQEGYVKFFITGIDNINAPTFVKNKIQFSTNISDDIYQFSNNDLQTGLYQPDSIKAGNVTWSHAFRIKKGVLYPDFKVNATVRIYNGYTVYEKTWQNIVIKTQNGKQVAYISTLQNDKKTSNLVQAFDGSKFTMPDSDYRNKQFQNIQNFLADFYLQVIPNYGIIWPNHFGAKNTNFNTRYFKRIFTGGMTDPHQVYGGMFRFGNLKKQDFLSREVSVKISMNSGQSWYSLNDQREGQNRNGIMTDVRQNGNDLDVTFALPIQRYFDHSHYIWFELAFSSRDDIHITSITLANENGEEF